MGGASNGLQKQIPELDQLVNKFNNSLAIQNMGMYAAGGGTQSFVGASNNSKSRNMNPGTFKTAITIGSTKGAIKNMPSN